MYVRERKVIRKTVSSPLGVLLLKSRKLREFTLHSLLKEGRRDERQETPIPGVEPAQQRSGHILHQESYPTHTVIKVVNIPGPFPRKS